MPITSRSITRLLTGKPTEASLARARAMFSSPYCSAYTRAFYTVESLACTYDEEAALEQDEVDRKAASSGDSLFNLGVSMSKLYAAESSASYTTGHYYS